MTSPSLSTGLRQRLIQKIAQKQKNSRSKQSKGFTLIELLVTIVIIGVLSAIALPNFLSQRTKAEKASLDAWASASARSCSSLVMTDEEASWTSAKVNPPTVTYSGAPTNANNCAGSGDVFNGGNKKWTVNADGSITMTNQT